MSFGGASSIEQRLQFEMVFGIVKDCFDDCITDFKSKDFSAGEQQCLANCAMRKASTQDLVMQVQQELSGQMGGSSGGF